MLLLREFGSVFSSLVETLLSSIVRESVQALGRAKTETSLQDCLVLVSKLGLEGNHICRIFAQEGGVGTLLRLLGETRTQNQRRLILRALGTVCCVEEGVQEFQEKRGLELLAGVLRGEAEERMEVAEVLRTDAEERMDVDGVLRGEAEERLEAAGVFRGEAGEMVRMEAAGVLAQVTSPWLDNCVDVSSVEEHAYDLVSSLTQLSSQTRSSETFLLCTAALANLSYLSPLMLTAMSQLDTLPPLLTFISHQVSPSIYILDQVATIVANLAASQYTRDSLLSQETVPALLLLLGSDPGTDDRPLPLLAATQRVQQKAAIAIGRLSVYRSMCLSVISGGGLDRLVELAVCKEARIDSDFTLVSVVTAVRRIAQVVDIRQDIQNLGAQDILDSNILHSIEIFSPMQESFV